MSNPLISHRDRYKEAMDDVYRPANTVLSTETAGDKVREAYRSPSARLRAVTPPPVDKVIFKDYDSI